MDKIGLEGLHYGVPRSEDGKRKSGVSHERTKVREIRAVLRIPVRELASRLDAFEALY